ncbi:MAG: M56 family metallopeptidase, partial [Verrucomicrobiales bacterium]|nr:M56 family metallopeptidase [Verrucomicrobiales bacterium]
MNEWIHWLNYFSLGWTEAIGRAVWQGSLLILAVWALSIFANKVLPAALRCWLWRIVLLKFALALVWVAPIPVPVLPPRSAPLDEAQSALSAQGIDVPALRAMSVSDRAVEPAPKSPSNGFKPEQLQAKSWPFLVWSVGFLICSFGVGRRWRQANRLRRGAGPSGNEPLKKSCRSLARELGCARAPLLMCSKEIHSPIVLGIWQPVILIPAALEQSEPSPQSRMMLAHELAHVRRRDLMWLWLLTFVRAVFFFNPLIWLAGRETRLAQEIACDELAVSGLQAQPAEYAMMLVDVAAGTEAPSAAPLAVGVAESYRTMKRRLKAMKYIHSQSKKQLAFAAMLVVVLGAGTIVPWQLVAQNAPAAELPIAPAPPVDVVPPPPLGAATVTLSDDETDPFPPSAKPGKRKRVTA